MNAPHILVSDTVKSMAGGSRRATSIAGAFTRRVDIRFQRHASHIVIAFQGQCPGFDWHKYVQIDPARPRHCLGKIDEFRYPKLSGQQQYRLGQYQQ